MNDDNEIKNTNEDVDVATQVNKWYKEARDKSSYWRKEAKNCFKFVAGDQWSDEDKDKLQKENRPAVVFNWIGPMIAVVLGIEANQRNEIHFEPREHGDTGLTDALNLFTNYQRDLASIDQEEAETFEDVVITGMGWSETFMDYDNDLDGEFKQEYRDCLEMYWDPSARKRNLDDRRWQIHARKMRKKDILEEWPDAQLVFDTPEDNSPDDPIVDNPTGDYDRDDLLDSSSDKQKDEKIVLRAQWYEKEPIYRVQDPESGQIVEVSEATFKQAKKVFEAKGAKSVKQYKKVYYEAFVCGNEVLESKKAPSQEYFTYNCMTGKRDKVKNCWYGIVRAMMDPQNWSNKFFSQIMDIIQSNAKGGVLAEHDAFLDAKKAEADWAKSDSIIWMKMGGLQKVLPKPVAAYPQGLDRLMNFAISSIRGVSGINLEVLGLAEREQAGVLEQMRKTSAFTILSSVFDALKNYRKMAGLLMIDFIRQYVPVEKIARILNAEDQRYAPMVKQLDAKTTDVVVTEAPSSENNKIMVWSFFSQMLPVLLKMGIPVPPDVLDYSPLPATLVEKWKAMLMQRMQQTGGQVTPPQQGGSGGQRQPVPQGG